VPKKKSFPSEISESWPEIFDHINIEVVPIEYLHSVVVRFHSGKVWEIDVKTSLKKKDVDIETALEELFEEYEDDIDSIDFRLDTVKVKKDINKRTEIFMKKRK
jgi:hypothetical protein